MNKEERINDLKEFIKGETLLSWHSAERVSMPLEQKMSDYAKEKAIAFSQYLNENRWYHFDRNTGKWNQTLEHPSAMGKGTYEKYHVKTTEQLYEIFNQQNTGGIAPRL